MNTYRGGTRRRQWRLAAVLLSLGLSACGGPSVAEGEKVVVVGPPTIEVVRVVEQPVNVTLSMPGELTPYQTEAIYPRVTGFIKTIRVDRGSRVRAGELLVLLDAPELAAQRSEAQSKLQSAEAQLGALRSKADADASTYERLKAAAATPGVAGNDLVLAQKAVEGDQGQVAAAQQNIEAARQALKSVGDMEGYLRVSAPFDGVVTERNVHPGAVDVNTRTMAVELDVANRDGRLASGTFCQVRWLVRRTGPSLLVPSGSVANTSGRTFVVRVRNGRTEWVDVKTGLGSGPLVEVFGDLGSGDEIAVRGTDEMRPGTEVRVKEVKPAAS